MGEKIPDVKPPWPPDLDPYKYYCVNVEAHSIIYGGCNDPDPSIIPCCQIGSFINEWWILGHECDEAHPLCYEIYLRGQRLLTVSGPYDSFNECNLVCDVE